MHQNTLIPLLMILCHVTEVFAMEQKVICFVRGTSSAPGWCSAILQLCVSGVAYNISITNNSSAQPPCLNKEVVPLTSDINYLNLSRDCNETAKCNMTWFSVPLTGNAKCFDVTNSCYNRTADDEKTANSSTTNSIAVTFPTINYSQESATTYALSSTISTTVTSTTGPTTKNNTQPPGIVTQSTRSNTTSIVSSTSSTYSLNGSTVRHLSAGSREPYNAVIAVSVAVFVIIVVVVVANLIYRRGHCKILLGKCAKGNNEHSPDMTDAYAMSSTANTNPTYNLSSDVDGNSCDVDYCEINKFGKYTDVEYNHVNHKKMQAIQDSTYNHIGHFYNSPGNNEQTYSHVGDETSQTDSSILQPDTYSHIGAVAKPAPEDSYAHINGVMQYIPAAYEMNQYDCTVFQSNGGQTGNSGHPGSEIKSGKEHKFIEVGPSKVDMNSDASVSHSYFVLEKT